MQSMTNEIQTELEALAARNGGVLSVHAVVEAAEPEDSVLHDWFEWDDGEAAALWRLEQARQLIRVAVTVIDRPDTKPVEVRTFVSLPSDRHAGGYRLTVRCLEDSDLRGEMLADALRELNRLRAKYQTLKELAPVFRALDKLEKKAS